MHLDCTFVRGALSCLPKQNGPVLVPCINAARGTKSQPSLKQVFLRCDPSVTAETSSYLLRFSCPKKAVKFTLPQDS